MSNVHGMRGTFRRLNTPLENPFRTHAINADYNSNPTMLKGWIDNAI
jgi:hypothetical protein